MGRWAEIGRGDGGAASAPLACLVVQVLAPRALDLGAARDLGHGNLPPGAAVGRGAVVGGVYHQHLAAAGRPRTQHFAAQFLHTAHVDGRPWNKTAPAPRLPREVIEQTAAKYQEALKRMLG